MITRKLEPIIQSEVSQKEKHQYSILTYCIFNIQCIYKIKTYIWNLEIGNNEPICETAKETQI